MRGIIREKTGYYIENTLLKYDGRPFDPEEIYFKAKEILSQPTQKNIFRKEV